MAYRVLIVDDSSFFQTRLKDIINECDELEVVGIASNGQEAIDKDDELKPDIISMDYEMPFVDGITAVRHIMAKRTVPIVMFSSMTYEGARITLDALDAGAVDFMPKNFAEVSKSTASLKKRLHDKLLTFARSAKPASAAPSADSQIPKVSPATTTPTEQSPPNKTVLTKGQTRLLIIGASTGGPVAVTDIITRLPADFPVPIVIVQHMPENFTRAFADRLMRQSKLIVKEAENGSVLSRGEVLVAPGGKQLMFDKNRTSIKILPADERVNYKPSVDIAFGSAAQVFGKQSLAVVLTGMGADGLEGARLIHQAGGKILAQHRDSCVVYGMPAAVINAGLADDVLDIQDFATKLVNEV